MMSVVIKTLEIGTAVGEILEDFLPLYLHDYYLKLFTENLMCAIVS